jgi:dUTP pyrophosphatase
MSSSADNQLSKLKCKLLHKDSKAPIKNSYGDCGYDLSSVEDTVVKSNERKLISTGISLQFDNTLVGMIKSRSGIAYKNSTDVCAGVIDSVYTGEIKVLLHNYGSNDFTIKVGDRIAQIVMIQVQSTPNSFEVVDEIKETERGSGGFGSTGGVTIQ